MAQLALGLAGAAVLGPAGFALTTASTGWLIGSTLGGLLFPGPTQRNQGPRLTDLSVQSSAYGQAVPIIYGTYRVAGNVIACSDKREVATTVDVGKGGPKVENTTYTYNVDIAIALCANEIEGIRKVWNNGKLIFDNSSGASLAAVLANELRALDVRVYNGTEDQMPDPSLEALYGIGSTPAYRGTAYIVFEQLDCPNGQIPQLSFEVVQAATIGPSVAIGTQQLLPISLGGFTNGIQPLTYVSRTSQPTPIFTQMVNAGGATGYTFKIDALGSNYLAPIGTGPQTEIRYQNSGIRGYMDEPLQAVAEITTATVTTGWLRVFDQRGDEVQRFRIDVANVDTAQVERVGKLSDRFVVIQSRTDSPGDSAISLFDWFSGELLATVYAAYQVDDVVLTSTYCWVLWDDAGTRTLDIYSLTDLTLIDSIALADELGDIAVAAKFAPLPNGNLGAVTLSNSQTLLILWEIDEDGVQTELARDASANVTVRGAMVEPADAIAIAGTSVYGVVKGAAVSGTYPVTPFVYRFRALDANGVDLADVIEDICARSGVLAPSIETTDVVETLTGYAITSVSSARANLEPLMVAYLIDATKSDGKVKFRPRASLSSVATISFDDLGAAADQQSPAEPFPLSRTLEDALPRSYAISYVNENDDYQIGTETARRIITESINDQTVQLAIAMDSDRAATVANALLFNDWAERNKRSLKLTRQFAALDAGDVITVEYPRGTFAPYFIKRAVDDGIVCDLEVVDFDGPIYTVAQSGSGAGNPQVVSGAASPTQVQLLDIPLLRDADDNAGLYVGAVALTSGWPGAVVYSGRLDSLLEPRLSFSQSTIAGVADTILGDWPNGTVDEVNTVEITLASGSLSTTTRENAITLQANVALLGGELLSFVRAESLGGRRYRLSGLVRALKGTEVARAAHRQGERFVLLQVGAIGRLDYDIGEINAERRFKAVTVGQDVSTVFSVPFTNTAEGLKPLSPINLRKNLDSSGNTFFTWDRRTRLSENWLAGSFPLGEEAESYDVELRNLAGDLLNSATVSTGRWDFPSGPSNLTSRVFTVWQRSAAYGRGSSVTLTV